MPSRVLIAEDDRAVRESVVRALTYEGYEVLAAPEGAEAIQIALNDKPDAIVLDVLRELTRLPSTPAGTSNILVTPVGGTYYVHVGRGLLDLAGDLLPESADIEQAVIVESDRDTGTGPDHPRKLQHESSFRCLDASRGVPVVTDLDH